MDDVQKDQTRQTIRGKYAEVAQQTGSCCGPDAPSSCCGDTLTVLNGPPNKSAYTERLGYSKDDIESVPEGANMGLGCGNPTALAALRPGEVVLDLGSGGGFDCFLASTRVGETGRAIGVDMTPEMVSKARANAKKQNFTNVEFRLGEMEHLPVADGVVDVIISNCVINLSPDKPSVLAEAYRVLKSGGRLAISDIVATAPFPGSFQDDEALLCGCVTGAVQVDSLREMLADAGFQDICVDAREETREFIAQWYPGKNVDKYVVSATIEARK